MKILINFLLIAAVIVNVSGFGGFGLGLIGKSAKPVCCPCPVDSDQSDAGASSAKTNAQRPIRDGLKKVVPVIKEMAPAFIEMTPGIVSIVSASRGRRQAPVDESANPIMLDFIKGLSSAYKDLAPGIVDIISASSLSSSGNSNNQQY